MNLANYKKTSIKNKIFIKIVVFVALVALVSYFAILPTMTKIIGLKKNIINSEISIKNSLDQKVNKVSLEKKLKTLEPQIEKIDQVFINKNRELEFITTLENIANKNKVEQILDLKNFPEKNTEFTTISLDLNTNGNFNNLMSYLSDLESSNYYININNFSITKGTGAKSEAIQSESFGDNSGSNLSLSIKADAFFK